MAAKHSRQGAAELAALPSPRFPLQGEPPSRACWLLPALLRETSGKLIDAGEGIGFDIGGEVRLVVGGVNESGVVEVAFGDHCLQGVVIAGVGSHDATNDASSPSAQT